MNPKRFEAEYAEEIGRVVERMRQMHHRRMLTRIEFHIMRGGRRWSTLVAVGE